MKAANTCMIVEVVARTAPGRLDPEDRSLDGSCAVDGLWAVALTGRLRSGDSSETALDVFHRVIPIARLDDFDITARPAQAGDAVREDLGLFSRLPDPPFVDRLLHQAFGAALLVARPDAPKGALVYHVDAGEPDSPNTLIEAAVFDRGILDEARMIGEPISLMLDKVWLSEMLRRTAPEIQDAPEP